MKLRTVRTIDASGLATGQYVLDVVDGKVTGLVAAGGAGGGGGGITVQDEDTEVATGVTQFDFQGAGVTATAGTGEVIVTIAGPKVLLLENGQTVTDYETATGASVAAGTIVAEKGA